MGENNLPVKNSCNPYKIRTYYLLLLQSNGKSPERTLLQNRTCHFHGIRLLNNQAIVFGRNPIIDRTSLSNQFSWLYLSLLIYQGVQSIRPLIMLKFLSYPLLVCISLALPKAFAFRDILSHSRLTVGSLL